MSLIDYSRVNWANGETGGTPLSATNLNTMDYGIYQIDQALSTVSVDTSGNLTQSGNLTLTGSLAVKSLTARVIVGAQTVTLTQTTAVDSGSNWTATGTLTAVSGASGYWVIPTCCNFGYVTKVSRSGTTITAVAHNASGETHTCTITALVLAYV